MCGISAIRFSSTQTQAKPLDNLETLLAESCRTLNHRGPDSHGIFVDREGLVGLSHARLSIVDIEGGSQPLHDDDDMVHAVVNGELYDYAEIRKDLEAKGCKFRSSVDSELIIHLYKIYGQAFVHHLRGEFAFVLYDERLKVLLAARDRFGIKPLYYTVTNGCLILASEMKAMLPFGVWKPEWDMESIVLLGEMNDNRTVFKGVYKLPAGHLLISRARTPEPWIRCYWERSFRHPTLVEHRSLDEMIEGVRSRIMDSVRARLRSDVPLAVYLSGGLDSSAIAGVARHLLKEMDPSAQLDVFTLAFPDRPEVDEGPIARRTAEHIGARIHFVNPSEAELSENFERAVYHTEFPSHTFHPAGKLILSQYTRHLGFKVVLTGEGSDEVFGGYEFFVKDFLRAIDPAATKLHIPLPTFSELQDELQAMEARPLRQSHFIFFKRPVYDLHATLGGATVHDGAFHCSAITDALSPSAVDPHVLADYPLAVAEGLSPEARGRMITGRWHPLHSAMYTFSKSVLQNYILNALGDRVEMAGSIEGRPPFLDHLLVEYVDDLPPSVKVMPSLKFDEFAGPTRWKFTDKWILREAVKPFITEEIYRRIKASYNAPIGRTRVDSTGPTNLTPLQVLVKSRITKESVAKLGWANWKYIDGILSEYLQPESPQYPVDGGLDLRAQILLNVISFIVLQEAFNVAPVDMPNGIS